jgi:two-component system, OmpR family, sensor histidine kinase VicK
MSSEAKPDELDQKVWIVNGAENILNFFVSRTNFFKESVVCCYDYYGSIRVRKTVPIWKTNLEVDIRN